MKKIKVYEPTNMATDCGGLLQYSLWARGKDHVVWRVDNTRDRDTMYLVHRRKIRALQHNKKADKELIDKGYTHKEIRPQDSWAQRNWVRTTRNVDDIKGMIRSVTPSAMHL